MGEFSLGDRVHLTASGSAGHPTVGMGGSVIKVVHAGPPNFESDLVTVAWDDGRESTVNRWNGVIARAGC